MSELGLLTERCGACLVSTQYTPHRKTQKNWSIPNNQAAQEVWVAGVQHSYLEFCPILVVRLCPGHLTPLSVFYQVDHETVDTPTLCQVAGMTEDKQAEGLEESRQVGSGRCDRSTDDDRL